MKNSKEMIKYLLSKDSSSFEDLCGLVSVLRSDDGCPWDREQTCKSIRNCIIDETYEFIEGLDTDNNELMCEELGDVLFQVVFHSDIKSCENSFDVSDVIDGICKKMILRHPHVFGNTNVENSSEVLVNWENIKNDEKKRKTPYEQLESVSKALPSLMRSQKLVSKAKKNNLIENSNFEVALADVKRSIESLEKSKNSDDLGKLLFQISSLASTLDVEAEQILYMENEKFVSNFKK